VGTPTIDATSVFLYFVTCIVNDTSSTALAALAVISGEGTDGGIERVTIEEEIRLG